MTHTANHTLTDPGAAALGWQPADSWPFGDEPTVPLTPVPDPATRRPRRYRGAHRAR